MPDIITRAGVTKLLSNLIVAKAAGPDSVRPIVLKELGQIIAPVATIIFQSSLDSGIVPSDEEGQSMSSLQKRRQDRSGKLPTNITNLHFM